jgi:nucleotide-binding universal stress UspA family protein
MASLFSTVLCPVDFDPNSLAALAIACENAAESGGKLFLLHVVPISVPAIGQPIVIEPLTGAEHDAQERLERIAREKLAGKVAYETIAVTGDPALEIVRVAAELNVDVIVMATHGRAGLSHLFLGSVAERVVRDSPRPVLTVRIHPD